MQANSWELWIELWRSSNPYSSKNILVIIIILIHNSIVLKLKNISSQCYQVKLKCINLLFDVIWIYIFWQSKKRHMAQVGILVPWKYFWGRKVWFKALLSAQIDFWWTFKFLVYNLRKTYITQVQQKVVFIIPKCTTDSVDVYRNKSYVFPSFLLQAPLFCNYPEFPHPDEIIPDVNNIFVFNWSQLLLKIEITHNLIYLLLYHF